MPGVEQGLNSVQTATSEYEARVTDLASRVAAIHAGLPDAIQRGSVVLTVVLVWIAVSRVIVVLFGLSLWRRRNAE
jgi:fatty acid desaturase